jgi:hypothetical protein
VSRRMTAAESWRVGISRCTSSANLGPKWFRQNLVPLINLSNSRCPRASGPDALAALFACCQAIGVAAWEKGEAGATACKRSAQKVPRENQASCWGMVREMPSSPPKQRPLSRLPSLLAHPLQPSCRFG